MSDRDNEFAAKISQIAQHILGIERRLNDLNDKFNHRPELQQLDHIQNALAQVEERLNDRAIVTQTPVEIDPPNAGEEQTPPRQSFESQLIFDRAASRAILIQALSTAQERLIIVCPWLSKNSIDADLLQRFRDCLDRNCCIEIGWGYLGDRANIGKGWRYNALFNLRQLEIEYPEQFKLKLIGTHEKFLVCDCSFALVGSHNLLASGIQSAEREVGIRTTDLQIIQGLRDRFDDTVAPELNAEIPTVDSTNYDSPDAIEVEAPSDESNASYENFDIELDADDNVDIEDSQTKALAEEFLRRYNSQERDFTGINLVRVDLSGKELGGGVNLSGADLTGAKLGKTGLYNVNLTGANLKNAKLSGANLYKTNLSKANLESADLRQISLGRTNIENANLSNANLSEVNLSQVKLNGTILSRANLSKANLRAVDLTAIDLSYANLSNANLLEANLGSANLQRVRLHQAIYNSTTIFPTGFAPTNAGAYLIAPNTSMPNANLAGYDLSGVNLTGSNLSGATLSSANLNNADLSEANLSQVDLTKASLQSTKLLQANLEEANLSEVKLNYANLTAANLVKANLIQADLQGANLTAADLSQANLKNTR